VARESQVLNHDRRGTEAQPRVREIEAAGGEAIAVETDIRDPESVQRMVAATIEAFGRVDILGDSRCPASDAHNPDRLYCRGRRPGGRRARRHPGSARRQTSTDGAFRLPICCLLTNLSILPIIHKYNGHYTL
jgi:hypothetical protein